MNILALTLNIVILLNGLSAAETNHEYSGHEHGLIALWHLNESLVDSSPNNYDLHQYGTITYVNGKWKTPAVDFNGTGKCYVIIDSNMASLNDAITVEAYVRLKDCNLPDNYPIVRCGVFELQIMKSKQIRFGIKIENNWYYVATKLPTYILANNTWYHIRGVYNNSFANKQVRLYINGILVRSLEVKGEINWTGQISKKLWIGGDWDTCSNLIIDEVAIWNRSKINQYYYKVEPTEAYEGYNIYWGDIHIHSNITDENPNELSIEELVSHARGLDYNRPPDVIGPLDWISITDHEHQISKKDWQYYLNEINRFNNPPNFVILPGYEWNPRNLYGELQGDNNLYFKTTNPPLLRRDILTNKSKLYEYLEKNSIQAIVIPHMTAYKGPKNSFLNNMSGENYNYKYNRLFEIYSGHGVEEYLGNPRAPKRLDPSQAASDPKYYYNWTLEQGQRMGVVAGSDSHDRLWIDLRPNANYYPYRGVTAVFAKNLTIEDIWNALYERRCYASEGQRYIVFFDINGYPMGSEVKVFDGNRYRNVTIKVYAPINRLIKNIVLLKGVPGKTNTFELKNWTIHDDYAYVTYTDIDNNETVYYYVRIITDSYFAFDNEGGLRIWTSPIWFDVFKKEEERQIITSIESNKTLTTPIDLLCIFLGLLLAVIISHVKLKN